MRVLIITIIAVLFLTSCKDKGQSQTSSVSDQAEKITTENPTEEQSGEKEEGNAYYKPQRQVIEGYVKDGANANVILDHLEIGEIEPITSILVKEDGSFYAETEVLEPGIYQLRFANGNIHLFLRGGHVQIKTDISDLGSYEIVGSDESYQLKEMYTLLNEINHKTADVQNRVDKLKKDKKKKKELIALLDSLPVYYAAINEEKSQRLQKFINRVDTSMVALLTAFYLNVDYNYEFLVGIRDKFASICPHSKIYKQFDDKISMVVPVGRGNEAPEIVIEDYNGDEHTLTKLRGNYVLLYFWASYSDPCRADNKKLKELYSLYKDEDFKIFALSIDEDKKFWEEAVKEDAISEWIHGSNLFGWDDEIAFVYKIDGIPYYILLDKEGIIIDRGFNIHELDEKLGGLFK